jgi:protein phosphatase
MPGISVGARVIVNGKHKAVVKYVGPTTFADGIWYGLELEREIGKHEGTVLGTHYFTAAPKRGTFVRPDSIALYDTVAAAAVQIGSTMRGALARKSVKETVAFNTFNALDADDEAQQLFRQVRLAGTSLGANLTRERPKAEELDAWEAKASAAGLGTDYTGPHLKLPLTADAAWALTHAFRDGRTLHYKYALLLVNAYRRVAGALPTVVESVVAPGEVLCVCGDTHGQLADLLAVFELNGVPSLTNRYLMNGDFVDRGQNGVEVVLTLMAWALAIPGAVMMNRGNHETHSQNALGGFLNEVLQKYASMREGAFAGEGSSSPPVMDRALHLYDAFQFAFDCLPLASIIASKAEPSRKAFVVHGGLLARPGVRIAQIAQVRRKRDIPFGQPTFEDKLFEDLMWSDPRSSIGSTASDRGAGVFFGSDVTSAFCSLNEISLVIRSHECMPEGFSFTHDDRLVTVFSASRYCGRGTNRGAFIVFDEGMAYRVTSFTAGVLADVQPAKLPRPKGAPKPANRSGVPEVAEALVTGRLAPAGSSPPPVHAPGLVRSPSFYSMGPAAKAAQANTVRRMLGERICLRKTDLYYYFSAVDRSPSGMRDGRLSKREWSDGMRAVLDIDLPWLSLCSHLATVEADGRINYTTFLDRYSIAMGKNERAWIEDLTERLSKRLLSACETLEAAYLSLDVNGDGQVEVDELEEGLKRLDVGLSKTQLVAFITYLDGDRNGRISLSEFKACFQHTFSRLKDEARGTRQAPRGSRDPALLTMRAAMLKGKPVSAATAVFDAIDTDMDGLISVAAFAKAVGALSLGFSSEECTRIAGIVDANGSGEIHFLEFLTALGLEAEEAGDAATVQTGGIVTKDWDAEALPADVFSAIAGKARAAHATSSIAASARASPTRAVMEKVVAVLYEYRVELSAVFNLFDTDRSGKISVAEFRVGLQSLTALSGNPLTDEQADSLLMTLDSNGDGEIDAAEFAAGFSVVDSHS